jgi:hypothetical protein
MARWSRIWVWHAAQLLVLFSITNLMMWQELRMAWPYVALWSVGFVSIVLVMWYYRIRAGIPLTPIEKQLSVVWCMYAIVVVVTAVINHLMKLEALQLLPLAVLECGLAFGCMAAILGGAFYPTAAACVVVAVIMTVFPAVGPLLFGVFLAVGLLIPAAKYMRSEPPSRG